MLNENNLFDKTNWKTFAQLREKIDNVDNFNEFEIFQLGWYLNNWEKTARRPEALTGPQIRDTWTKFNRTYSLADQFKLHSLIKNQIVLLANNDWEIEYIKA